MRQAAQLCSMIRWRRVERVVRLLAVSYLLPCDVVPSGYVQTTSRRPCHKFSNRKAVYPTLPSIEMGPVNWTRIIRPLIHLVFARHATFLKTQPPPLLLPLLLTPRSSSFQASSHLPLSPTSARIRGPWRSWSPETGTARCPTLGTPATAIPWSRQLRAFDISGLFHLTDNC